jgi:hypothetical protein
MTTGILLIGIGHKNYGCMAANLAMSLRANGCDLPITLVTQPETITRLDDAYKALFTDIKYIEPHCYTLKDNTECYIKAKAHMDELTPYDYTLFIDADVIIINNHSINAEIEKLKGIDFTIKNKGLNNKFSIWADMDKVVSEYKLEDKDIYEIHSEFIWWKKGQPAMAKWAENFENLKVAPTNFAGCIADELPLFISMAQTDTKPHMLAYNPIYWFNQDSKHQKRIKDMKEDGYCGLSIGGNMISIIQQTSYDVLVTIYSKMFNMKLIFKSQQKKRWDANRNIL